MKNIISYVRMRTRKYKFLFRILRRIHIICVGLLKAPHCAVIIYKDIKKIKERSNEEGNINWLINVPNHANLGDQAMALAERKLINELYPSRKMIELSREVMLFLMKNPLRKLLFIAMKEDDYIWVQGGYTSCDKTPNEKVHRFVADYICSPMVFFPQTVHYTNEFEKKITADIYNKKRNILFLARDRISHVTIKQEFGNITTLLYPDIVSSLIGRTSINFSKSKKGVLFCIREDGEKKYTHKEIEEVKKNLSTLCNVDSGDLMLGKPYQTPDNYYKLIVDLLESISKYKIVVTDRFHGILFSLISNTKVVALDSIDYKVKEGAEMFGDIYPGSCFYANSIGNAVEIVNREYFSEEKVLNDDRCYEYYYKHFKELIDRIVSR